MERKPLIGGQGIDMPDGAHLSQVDFALIAVGIAQVVGIERNCRAVSFANSN